MSEIESLAKAALGVAMDVLDAVIKADDEARQAWSIADDILDLAKQSEEQAMKMRDVTGNAVTEAKKAAVAAEAVWVAAICL